jgi:hypothetical protein
LPGGNRAAVADAAGERRGTFHLGAHWLEV